MKRSLFWLLDYHPHAESNEADTMLKAIEHCCIAERLGFTAAWSAEHHFQTLGMIPNPAVFLAALSQKTTILRIGPAISVLPLHNSIQIAEDYAMVDQLSGGRLNMGVGTGGQAIEAQGMGTQFGKRKELFEQNLIDVIDRWTIASAGKINIDSINAAPIQTPTPPIYVTSNQAGMAYKIGLAGRSLLTLVSPSVGKLEDIGERISAHKRGLRDGGHPKTVAEAVVVIFTHLNDSEERAREIAIPALGHTLSAMSGNPISDATDIYHMMQRTGAGLFGSEQQASEIVTRYAEVGVEHIAFLNRFGAMPWDEAEQSLNRLT